MIALFNFVLCSGLLLLVYRVFLQGEKMYRFNRFYLLFSLLFSAAVPFVTINNHSDTLPVNYQHTVEQVFATTPLAITSATPISLQPSPQQANADVSPAMLFMGIAVAIYVLVALILFIRFAVNLYRIGRVVVLSERIELGDTHVVLTDNQNTPHSFLNYVFVNRDDYLHGLEPQIICHEQAHIRQRHSLDVLLVELLQVLCWFNPFLPLYRRAIQLNHEFLADEAVIARAFDTVAYQYLLLAKASQHNSIHLASQFNYQTTKKRLNMMTKNTSAPKAIGRQLLMLPVAATALMLFSQKTTATILPKFLPVPVISETPAAKKDTNAWGKVRFPIPSGWRTKYSKTDAPEKVMSDYAAILKKYGIPDADVRTSMISTADRDQLHALFIQMSKSQQDGQQFRFTKAIKPMPKSVITAEQISKWQDTNKYGIWVDGKRIKNSDLVNYNPEEFDNVSLAHMAPLGVKLNHFQYQVDLMTKPYYADYYKKTMANQQDRMDYWHVQQPRKK